jgi:hypothetical protein
VALRPTTDAFRASPFAVKAALSFVCLAGALSALSCARSADLVVALDETFAAARPSLAAALENLRPPGFERRALRISLQESPARVLDYLNRLARDRHQVVLVASPLLASALLSGDEFGRTSDVGPSSASYGLDTMPLIVPEGSLAADSGAVSVDTDPIPAFRAAGRACGAYIAAIKAERGGAPSCGIVYASSPSRPRSTIEAFAAAYGAASDAAPLLVRELPATISPNAPNTESEAQAAVEELLGSDMRILFVAAGGSTLAALKVALNPDLVLGAELSGPSSPPYLAFRIVPNDLGLARAVEIVAERRNRGAKEPRPKKTAENGSTTPIFVPALLLEGPAATYHMAASPPFASFMEKN